MIDVDWLPDSYQSSRVLNAIRKNEDGVLSEVPERYRARLAEVTSQYQLESRALGPNYAPRNLPFYHMIRRVYPRFRWLEVGVQTDVETYYRGKKQALLSYLLDLIPSDAVATSAKISRAGIGNQVIDDVERYLPVLRQLGACSPSPATIARFNSWIEKARTGARMTLVSPVCPDYSAEAGSERTYRFTFQSVGTGCGLAGSRLLESIAGLHALLEDLGCRNFSHHICIGDFEAFSEANLSKVGLSCDEFLARSRQSALAIAAAAPVPVKTSLFTDHCGGREGWTARHEAMVERFQRGDFGPIREDKSIRDIAEARRGLYERWHDRPGADLDFLLEIVIQQGAEYAAMGEIIASAFENPLVVGADHYRMAPFYNFGTEIPVLYLDRNYD